MLGALGQFALGQFPFLSAQVIERIDVGGYAKKRKKQSTQIDEDIRRSQRLRADLELAIYGPEETEWEAIPLKLEMAKSAIDVSGLSKVIAARQHQNYLDELKNNDNEDEDELNMILKDIL